MQVILKEKQFYTPFSVSLANIKDNENGTTVLFVPVFGV